MLVTNIVDDLGRPVRVAKTLLCTIFGYKQVGDGSQRMATTGTRLRGKFHGKFGLRSGRGVEFI